MTSIKTKAMNETKAVNETKAMNAMTTTKAMNATNAMNATKAMKTTNAMTTTNAMNATKTTATTATAKRPHGVKLAIAIAVVALSQVGATDCGEVIRDSGFDLWCGDHLCAWKVVRGDVRRVGTWNAGDSGVELVGDDAAIQQLAPVNSSDGLCIEFTLIANVDENAEVFLDVDVQADGRVERQERVPTARWEPVAFRLFVKPPYDGIRFELEKHGAGTAVLAQIGARISDGCDGLPQIDAGPRPDGSGCVEAADCASGRCAVTPLPPPGGSAFGTVCTGCDPAAAACGAGEVCGIGNPLAPVLAVPVECVPAGTRQLAEQCIADDQCASGICAIPTAGAVGLCSACAGSSCGGGACAPAWDVVDTDAFVEFIGPHVCRPGEHAGTPGDACGTDADCASDRCNGPPRKVCNDGRPCGDTSSCPTAGLQPGACTTVGVEGGSCD